MSSLYNFQIGDHVKSYGNDNNTVYEVVGISLDTLDVIAINSGNLYTNYKKSLFYKGNISNRLISKYTEDY